MNKTLLLLQVVTNSKLQFNILRLYPSDARAKKFAESLCVKNGLRLWNKFVHD